MDFARARVDKLGQGIDICGQQLLDAAVAQNDVDYLIVAAVAFEYLFGGGEGSGFCALGLGVDGHLAEEHLAHLRRGTYVEVGAGELAGAGFERGEFGCHLARHGCEFANGRVASTTIVIPEGLTIKQIKNLLLRSSALTGAVECKSGNSAPVCNLRDGDVFPDTYTVARGMNRLAVLDLARKKMVNIQGAWERTNRRLPKPLQDWDDVITLASIVQKETPQAREMPIVASVYLNRLNRGMRLQADPTVVYALTDGLGDMQGQPLLRGHLKIDSPYNTYRNKGLPPAPIANVGENAIRAVLRPADTNYLFFVADGRGGHLFSKDYEEHKKNHNDWREIKKLKNKN